MLPGKIYDKDAQCRIAFPGSPGSCASFNQNICESLWCKSPSNPHSCVGANVGAADGTQCGLPNKICYRRQCDPMNSIHIRPLPTSTLCSDATCKYPLPSNTVHGGWADWELQSPCSRSCGGGFLEQRRQCTNPIPDVCGKSCKGESTRIAVCNMQPCTCPQDGTLPYFYEDRAVQCSVHNRRMRVSDLVPASLRNERENQPCRLFCYSATIQTYYIGSNVEDGTKCDQYSNDRCYRGDCQV
jgi:hypothetical protein